VLAVPAWADDLAAAHHGDAAHDGVHRPAFQHLVFMQTVVGVGAEFGAAASA